jgi:hypothetical protein
MPRPTLAGRTGNARRLLVAIAIAGLLSAACGSPGSSAVAGSSPMPGGSTISSASPASPSPTASGLVASPASIPSPSPTAPVDEAALYRQIEGQVVALRGLPAKQYLEPTILDEAQLRVRLEAQLRAENPPAEIAASQATLVAMGLLPPGTSLADLYVNLLGSQVAGYYNPATKQIFVVARTGQIGAIEKVTFAHEFTHALQDQNFGLKGITTDTAGQGDRSMAQLALIEGDASLLMTQWLMGHLDGAGIAQIMAGDPAAQAQLDATPPFLKDQLLFPYLQGVAFVSSIWAQGGWAAVDRVFSRLPVSTQQILHPDKYASDEQPVSVPLDAPAIAARLGAGWTAAPADTLGEFQIGSWLRARGVTGAGGGISGDTASAGWAGDRYALIDGPNGAYALVIRSTWDTPADATEFATAAKEAVRGVPGVARVVRPASSKATSANAAARDVTVLFARDAGILGSLAAAAAP